MAQIMPPAVCLSQGVCGEIMRTKDGVLVQVIMRGHYEMDDDGAKAWLCMRSRQHGIQAPYETPEQWLQRITGDGIKLPNRRARLYSTEVVDLKLTFTEVEESSLPILPASELSSGVLGSPIRASDGNMVQVFMIGHARRDDATARDWLVYKSEMNTMQSKDESRSAWLRRIAGDCPIILPRHIRFAFVVPQKGLPELQIKEVRYGPVVDLDGGYTGRLCVSWPRVVFDEAQIEALMDDIAENVCRRKGETDEVWLGRLRSSCSARNVVSFGIGDVEKRTSL
jgi:hypothetical protein